MHIIDFIRETRPSQTKTENPSSQSVIELPPYHRGHLGFLPETNVHMGIHGDGHLFEKGCELIVSAYPSVTANLAELSCTMKDSIGVVNKLLRSLRSLNVNILVAETYSIKHHKRHHLEMVFDWSSSWLPRPDDVPIAFQSTVNRLHRLVPNDDFRYVRLLGRILQCCAADLIWEFDEESQFAIPSVRLRSFEHRSTFAGTGRSAIEKLDATQKKATVVAQSESNEKHATPTKKGHSGKKAEKLVIGLGDIEHDLRRILDLSGRQIEGDGNQPLPYLMLSDTASRCLRVWFPQNDKKARQIIHVGFQHSDISGALETITKVLKFSDFNLVTSLLRRGKQGQNVWEVHLQYEILDENLQKILKFPKRRGRLGNIINWFCSKIDLDAVSQKWRSEFGTDSNPPNIASDLKRFKVYIRAPEYPPIKNQEELEMPFMWKEEQEVQSPEETRIEDEAGRAERLRWTEIATRKRGLSEPQREWALSLALADGIPIPRVFLSYPSTASQHANRIKMAIVSEINSEIDELGGEKLPYPRLIVDEFQDPNLKEISDTVFKMIRRADFFLGIWHSDKSREDAVSPWMPYEYGIAAALGKPTAVIVRDTIPSNVWQRIDPHISKPIYNDLSFQEDTVHRVVEHIKSEWLRKIPENARKRGIGRLWGKDVPRFD